MIRKPYYLIKRDDGDRLQTLQLLMASLIDHYMTTVMTGHKERGLQSFRRTIELINMVRDQLNMLEYRCNILIRENGGN